MKYPYPWLAVLTPPLSITRHYVKTYPKTGEPLRNPIPQGKPPRDNTLTPPKDLLIKLATFIEEMRSTGRRGPLTEDPQVLAWLESMRQKGLLD